MKSIYNNNGPVSYVLNPSTNQSMTGKLPPACSDGNIVTGFSKSLMLWARDATLQMVVSYKLTKQGVNQHTHLPSYYACGHLNDCFMLKDINQLHQKHKSRSCHQGICLVWFVICIM